jgi:outer membrane protein assembly factor BamB
VLLDGPDRKTLAMVVLEEVWGIDPATGELKWRVPGFKSRGYTASFAVADGVIYHPGGMLGGSSFALPAEVPGNAPRTFVWTSNNYESIISPLVYDGFVYGTTNRGVAYCLDAKTGQRLYQVRLASGPAEAGGAPGRSGRSGPGGGEYASPILADGRIYVVTRPGITYVLAAAPQFQLLAKNTLGADTSGFCATPAVGDNALFIRSNQCLYCVAQE